MNDDVANSKKQQDQEGDQDCKFYKLLDQRKDQKDNEDDEYNLNHFGTRI